MKSEIEINFEKLNDYIVAYFQNNDDSLLEAKDLFSPFIESNRQLEKVKDIQQLLMLLKRRGLYLSYDFNTFRIFQKIIPNEEFSSLVARHQGLLRTYQSNGEPRNIYGTINIPCDSNYINNGASSSSQNSRRDGTSNKQGPNKDMIQSSENTRNTIFNIISNGISLYEFRRLARHLDFSREEIMDIELKCNDYRTQNLVLLGKYEERRNSMTRLLKVLELIEKPDLVKEINDVMKRNQ